MRTERRFVRAGEYLELLGTNLFLEADHVLLSGAWWLVRRGGLLVRAALDCLRLAMDGVLAVITECWRFLWSCVEMCLDGLLQSVLYLVSNVWRMGLFVVNAAVKTTWQHPEAGALLGTVVVACALLVHHDSVPNPLALAWAARRSTWQPRTGIDRPLWPSPLQGEDHWEKSGVCCVGCTRSWVPRAATWLLMRRPWR